LAIINQLGLSKAVQHYHIGFMGCNAALPVMRMAEQFCRADARAVVLLVCIELCSLHYHFDEDLDTLLANSLFADGAAAALISAAPPKQAARAYKLQSFASAVLPDGASDMAWRIGDRGFDIVLSKYVPRIIGANIKELVEQTLGRESINAAAIKYWAVHPGGKSILDKVEQSLGLAPLQLEASRRVLRRYGNMSSATILFVLREILSAAASKAAEAVYAMAFGPGLTVESARLETVAFE
jgi:predicted naringenin-chalcone synthase